MEKFDSGGSEVQLGVYAVGLLDRLFGGKKKRATGVRNTRNAVLVTVRCNKCGEVITLRLRKTSEIQRDYTGSADYAFYVQKTVVGNNCFNRMQLRLEFDPHYQVIEQELTGGEFVDTE